MWFETPANPLVEGIYATQPMNHFAPPNHFEWDN